MRITVALAVFSTLAVAVAAAQAPSGWPAVREFFIAGLEQHGIAGGTLAFVHDTRGPGAIIAIENHGVADRATEPTPPPPVEPR